MPQVTDKFPAKTRIFASDVWESMTRTNPIWPVTFWVPASIAMIAWTISRGTHPLAAAGFFLFGLLLWTLSEYLLHRFAFHYVPTSARVRRFYFLIHQVHHDHPEYDRIVMPVPGAMILGSPILALLFLALGGVNCWATFAGVVVGYLAYDYTHLATHFGKPRTRWMKGLRRRHQQHHHAYPDRWFGVSSPLWDYVFRTHVRRGERPTGKAYPGNLVDWNRPDFVVNNHGHGPTAEAAE